MSGILTRLFEPRALDENTGWGLINKMRQGGLGTATTSGVTVTPESSLQQMAVFACVRVLAESVSSLPLITYQRLPTGGKARAQAFYLYRLLHDRPNPEMTSMELRELIMVHLALRGNAYCEIVPTNGGRVAELWPLRPDKMQIMRDGAGELVYSYQLPSHMDGQIKTFRADQILHIRGLGMNGVVGISPIAMARQAIGLAVAAEEYGARFFDNDARPGGVLQHPGQLDDPAYERLKRSWADAHQGRDNAHRIAILEEGLEFKEVGIAPQDAQFLETRKFQTTEIARMYRVPPHMIMDLERSTNNNIEHQGIEFVVHTLRPYLVRMEQRMQMALMTEQEQAVYFIEHNVDGLLRGDMPSRYAAYNTGIMAGFLSRNEARERENMNSVPGGDTMLVPMNMMAADQIGAQRALGAPHPNPPGARELPVDIPDGTEVQLSARPRRTGNGVQFEERTAKAASARHRMQQSHVRVYRDVATRILKRESRDIKDAVDKYLRKRSASDFSTWLTDFYREHQDFVVRTMQPVALAYGETAAAVAAEEVSFEEDTRTAVERFMQAYVDAYGIRHVAIGESIVRKVM